MNARIDFASINLLAAIHYENGLNLNEMGLNGCCMQATPHAMLYNPVNALSPINLYGTNLTKLGLMHTDISCLMVSNGSSVDRP